MSSSGQHSYVAVGRHRTIERPPYWNLVPLFAVAKPRNYKNVGMLEDNLLSLSYGRIVRRDINTSDGLLPESFETYQIVEPGDTVFRLTDLQNDQRSLRTALVTERGIITSAYLALEPIGIVPEFFAYLARAYDHEKTFYKMGSGLRQSLKFEELRRLPVLLPPPEEQRRIASFLDYETARIDELVHEQEKLLSLLAERRAASIRSAIRGGVHYVAPQHLFERDWLGEVPESWRKLPVRAAFFERVQKNLLGNEVQYLSLLAGIGVVRYEDKGNVGNKKPEDLSKCKMVRKGDFVLNSMNFGIGAFGRSSLDGVCSPVYVVLTPRLGIIEPRYAMRIFQDKEFQAYAQSFGNGILAHRSAIGWSELKNIALPIPPIDEQKRILTRLDSELSDADQLIADTGVAISLMLERRAALITAAVTGQLDLRGWQPLESAAPAGWSER